MIPVPSGAQVWLATGHTDMRKGFDGLALLVQETLKRNPHNGHLFVFRGRRGGLIKVLWHEKHHRATPQIRAHEEPLPAAEMTRASHKFNPPVQRPDLNAQVPLRAACKVRGDNPLAPLPPLNHRPSVSAGLNPAVANCSIDVELEPAFQANTLA
jgi:IS66 Orf2 like protein